MDKQNTTKVDTTIELFEIRKQEILATMEVLNDIKRIENFGEEMQNLFKKKIAMRSFLPKQAFCEKFQADICSIMEMSIKAEIVKLKSEFVKLTNTPPLGVEK